MKPSSGGFNTYHRNQGLLFQFILSEFLLASQELKIIRPIIDDLKVSSFENHIDLFNHPLKQSITKLSGSSQEYMRIFTWNREDGILAKIRNYCAILSQQTNPEDKQLTGMNRNANKAWLLSLQALDVMWAFHQENTVSISQKQKHSIALCRSLSKMCAAIDRFSRLVPTLLKQFRNDENVIFFLIRSQQQFDIAYEPRFVAKIVKKMYPKGLEGAKQFLISRYTDRGFVNLIPTIRTKIDELQL